MRLFIDANVLVTILTHEYPRFSACAKVMSLGNYHRNQDYLATSTLCLGIAFYFAEKKSGTKKALKNIQTIIDNSFITDCGSKETILARKDQRVEDFEDGLQYYSAMGAGCTHIITYNASDFYFSEIPVLTPEDFLVQAGYR